MGQRRSRPPAAIHVPNLRDFERRLGGLVEGLFSKTFRSGVQPVEIAKRVVREMDDSKQVAINEVWAPNRFEISLFVGHDLRKGDLEVEASLVQGEEKVPPAAVAEAAEAGHHGELLVHGADAVRRVPLDKEMVTIGRLAESDVMIDDKAVSRRHAQIRTKDGRSTLTDLGSTNGTKLNGQQVQSRPLSDGDRITVGNTVIEYRRV